MKTCIKMSCGNVYVVDGSVGEVTDLLSADVPFIKISGTKGREPFFLNPEQVCSVYPARPE